MSLNQLKLSYVQKVNPQIAKNFKKQESTQSFDYLISDRDFTFEDRKNDISCSINLIRNLIFSVNPKQKKYIRERVPKSFFKPNPQKTKQIKIDKDKETKTVVFSDKKYQAQRYTIYLRKKVVTTWIIEDIKINPKAQTLMFNTLLPSSSGLFPASGIIESVEIRRNKDQKECDFEIKLEDLSFPRKHIRRKPYLRSFERISFKKAEKKIKRKVYKKARKSTKGVQKNYDPEFVNRRRLDVGWALESNFLRKVENLINSVSRHLDHYEGDGENDDGNNIPMHLNFNWWDDLKGNFTLFDNQTQNNMVIESLVYFWFLSIITSSNTVSDFQRLGFTDNEIIIIFDIEGELDPEQTIDSSIALYNIVLPYVAGSTDSVISPNRFQELAKEWWNFQFLDEASYFHLIMRKYRHRHEHTHDDGTTHTHRHKHEDDHNHEDEHTEEQQGETDTPLAGILLKDIDSEIFINNIPVIKDIGFDTDTIRLEIGFEQFWADFYYELRTIIPMIFLDGDAGIGYFNVDNITIPLNITPEQVGSGPIRLRFVVDEEAMESIDTSGDLFGINPLALLAFQLAAGPVSWADVFDEVVISIVRNFFRNTLTHIPRALYAWPCMWNNGLNHSPALTSNSNASATTPGDDSLIARSGLKEYPEGYFHIDNDTEGFRLDGDIKGIFTEEYLSEWMNNKIFTGLLASYKNIFEADLQQDLNSFSEATGIDLPTYSHENSSNRVSSDDLPSSFFQRIRFGKIIKSVDDFEGKFTRKIPNIRFNKLDPIDESCDWYPEQTRDHIRAGIEFEYEFSRTTTLTVRRPVLSFPFSRRRQYETKEIELPPKKIFKAIIRYPIKLHLGFIKEVPEKVEELWFPSYDLAIESKYNSGNIDTILESNKNEMEVDILECIPLYENLDEDSWNSIKNYLIEISFDRLKNFEQRIDTNPDPGSFSAGDVNLAKEALINLSRETIDFESLNRRMRLSPDNFQGIFGLQTYLSQLDEFEDIGDWDNFSHQLSHIFEFNQFSRDEGHYCFDNSGLLFMPITISGNFSENIR